MTDRTAARQLPGAPARAPLLRPRSWYLALAGLAAMAVPTFIRVAEQSWSTETGAHGPIVAASGAWLLFHTWRAKPQEQVSPLAWWAIALASLTIWLVYVVSRAFDFLVFEVFALWCMSVCIVYRLVGFAELRRLAFPLFYLAFLIPLPGSLVRLMTEPLKMLVSWSAAGLVQAAGYPVARQGVSIAVSQYQFLVEDACSGLNSLTGLVAISLFYIYVLHRSSPLYALGLLAVVVPIAVAVNIARVLALILMTYYYGDQVAQGFMHATTGLILYGSAIVIIFALDMLFQRFRVGVAHA